MSRLHRRKTSVANSVEKGILEGFMSESASSVGRLQMRHPFWTRWKIVFMAGLFVLLTILLAANHNRDSVRFKGRLLSDYFVDLVRPRGGGSYEAATNALFSLGDEALPVVLRYVERPAPLHVRWFVKWKDKLPGPLQSYLFRELDPYRQVNRHEGAMRAVEILGTNAIPIARQLAEALGRVNSSDRALLASTLAKVGPAIVPHLRRYLPGQDLDVRSAALDVIGQLGPDAVEALPDIISGIAGANEPHLRKVAGILSGMGSRAASAASQLLNSTNAQERFVAIEVLGRSRRRSPDEVVRLVAALNDPDGNVRLQAAYIIASWWPPDLRNTPLMLFSVTLASAFSFGGNPTLPEELQTNHDLWLKVLREGLDRPDFDKRLASASVLLGLGQADDGLVKYLDDLKNSQPTNSFQRQSVEIVLDRARAQAIARRYGATNVRPSRSILPPQASRVR